MGFLSTGLFDRSRASPQPVYQAEAKDGVEADPVCSESTLMVPAMQKTEYRMLSACLRTFIFMNDQHHIPQIAPR